MPARQDQSCRTAYLPQSGALRLTHFESWSRVPEEEAGLIREAAMPDYA